MTRQELTDKVCAAASEIIGKPIEEGRLDVGTRGLIAVLADNPGITIPADSPDDTDDNRAETENAGGPSL